MSMLDRWISRRRFLQASGALGATTATTGVGHLLTLTPRPGHAKADGAVDSQTQVVKNVCHQCPARCGIDVYSTNDRVHAIYGDLGNPIANGKLCPKGHLGPYFLYDPDRFKGPMKRTNPNKGRDEDPEFVPISWEEALDEVAQRLNRLRERDESHRFAIMYGRGWGESDAGIQYTFQDLYGSPNVIGHSSMCSDGSEIAKKLTDGHTAYNAYDYRHTNYILNFGAGFLEAFRPYNYLMQVWGEMRTKSPRTQVTAIDVHQNTTLASADRGITIKPGTDGAMALAIAHELLVHGYWDRNFVGDFTDGVNRFEAGRSVEPGTFEERWTSGLIRWWNDEVKDRTPEWAEEITTVSAETIRQVAQELGTTRPAIVLFERGPTAHSNGTYNGMAIHALNALVGSLFAEGGLFYQMPPPYADGPADPADYMDEHAQRMRERLANGDTPRIDMVGTERWPLAKNMMQEVAQNHSSGDPYQLDTMLFYLTNPIWTAPDATTWEEALKDVFIIDTSPFPGETAMYADLILPDHTYLERLQDVPTYPFEGYPLTALRTPAVEPVYDTKVYGDILIEIGKRLDGPAGEYWRQVDDTENLLRHWAEGFQDEPGDNGVNDFESWMEKGVWYKKPYHWKQERGIFYEWVEADGDYTHEMSAEEVAEKLMPTPSGRFEFVSRLLQEEHADFVASEFGIERDRAGVIQWVEPHHPGGGDLYLSTPKTALHAEGRGANLPHTISHMQPVLGGNTTVYAEIHTSTAQKHGIRSGDWIRVSNELGSIEAIARLFEGVRPDTICIPMEHGHWAQGRWAKGRPPGHSGEITVNQSDRLSGLANYYSTTVRVERA